MLHTQAHGELLLSENSSPLASVCVKPLPHLKYLATQGFSNSME